MLSPDQVLQDVMRASNPFCNLVDYMYIGGIVRLRCGVCRCRPISKEAFNVLWCDECIDAFIDADNVGPAEVDEWIEKRSTIPRGYDKITTP